MQQNKDVLMKLRKAKEHFQQKAFLSEDENSKTFYKGKASGLQLAIEHVQTLVKEEQDSWDDFINKMYDEYNKLQEVKR